MAYLFERDAAKHLAWFPNSLVAGKSDGDSVYLAPRRVVSSWGGLITTQGKMRGMTIAQSTVKPKPRKPVIARGCVGPAA